MSTSININDKIGKSSDKFIREKNKFDNEDTINKYLDFINECKVQIDILTNSLSELNNILLEYSNDIDNSKIEIFENLKKTYKISLDFINNFKKNPSLKSALKNSIDEFNDELDNLKEIIEDLDYRLNTYPSDKKALKLIKRIKELSK
ncbi:MAG: hypothetical protein A2X61_13335 [Ignavibacteria bacterium GWB2_35_12]|nr:MAG: hypothetical protein A2X63_12545 [Ignavibacteria bacterium GWA2_35_8]OGU41441.1 MAG: hypothetical protein A2X61_13335 [Ignavibacteria bacterium GWB2_35_12]OGU94995.1 MAG: hypothetical protein A2220_09505 [Ignavibacteria bacterium RIFOXYA2_FULL_35_10]OGV19382.1 MAG: hypothetical protein A2475_04755 [Ignavibacteria bacterium RIFOXYC2_FULL_35_21]